MTELNIKKSPIPVGLVQFARIFIGVLFIFSGWIKANDPMGFGYKLAEYFDVFGTEIFKPFSTEIAIAISTFEIMLGVLLLLGAWINLTSLALLLLIIFFTFLTFYSAYFNKVTDCGCFGDALHLKPWQSFSKDIILLIFILIVFIGRKAILPILNGKKERVAVIFSFSAVLSYTFYCWTYLPIKDFRPYAIGQDIKANMEPKVGDKPDSFVTTFVYEKGGKNFTFKTEDLMTVKDLGSYKYKSTENKLVREGQHPAIHDFVINSRTGINMKDTFLSQKGYRLMIVQYDLKLSSIGGQQDVNKLVRNIYKNALLPVWPLTAASESERDEYRKMNMVPYDFFTADATMLKTVIRSNPGLVLFKDNVVVKMWPSSNIPDIEEFKKALK